MLFTQTLSPPKRFNQRFRQWIKNSLLALGLTCTVLPGLSTAAVQGIKFNDLNGNGVQDIGEKGISGTIFIRDKEGEKYKVATDINGNFFFNPPKNNVYTFSTGIPLGWIQTTPFPFYTTSLTPKQSEEINFGVWDGITRECQPLIVDSGPNMVVELGQVVMIEGSVTYQRCDEENQQDMKVDLERDFGDGNLAVIRVEIPAGEQTKTIYFQKSHSYLREGPLSAKLIANATDNTRSRKVREEGADEAAEDDSDIVTQDIATSDPCEDGIADIQSIQSGNWNNPNIWNLGRVPTPQDWVKIKNGHTITLPESRNSSPPGGPQMTGLCVSPGGVVQSAPNTQFEPTWLVLNTQVINNQGTIQGQDGRNAQAIPGIPESFQRATPGSGVAVYALRIKNTGEISSGEGGSVNTSFFFTDAQVNRNFPSTGAAGGNIDINVTSSFINEGKILGGNGGDARRCSGPPRSCVHGRAEGGKGGSIAITDEIPEAKNIGGFIQSGKGGHADLYINGSNGHPGEGGDLNVFIDDNRDGKIRGGGRGSEAHIDPRSFRMVDDNNTVSIGGDAYIGDADKIVIFGGDGWELNFQGISKGAINAYKTIIIAVGKEGVIDLRNVAAGALKAGEEVKIYSDNILLDEGVALETLVDAPVLTVEGAKILYRAHWSGNRYYLGEPGETLTITQTIVNDGPKKDKYTLSVAHNDNVQVQALPEEIPVNGLRRTQVDFQVTFPENLGEQETITLTATSKNESSFQITRKIQLRTPPKEPIKIIEGEYTASGTLHYRKDNSPIANATILVSNKETVTNEAGYWEVSGLVATTYPVVAILEGKVVSFTRCTITEEKNDCTPIPLATGSVSEFTATPLANGKLQFNWATLSETNTAGFTLWQAKPANADCNNYQGYSHIAALNGQQPIPAIGQSNHYEYVNPYILNGYCYGLEEINYNGNTNAFYLIGPGISDMLEVNP